MCFRTACAARALLDGPFRSSCVSVALPAQAVFGLVTVGPVGFLAFLCEKTGNDACSPLERAGKGLFAFLAKDCCWPTKTFAVQGSYVNYCSFCILRNANARLLHQQWNRLSVMWVRIG